MGFERIEEAWENFQNDVEGVVDSYKTRENLGLKTVFTHNSTLEGQQMKSQVRTNREYLMSTDIAKELNTYANFGVFPVWNDAFDLKYEVAEGKETLSYKKSDGTEVTETRDKYAVVDASFGAPGVRSIFNKAGAVMTGVMGKNNYDSQIVTNDDIVTGRASNWRISNNVPLMDNPENRQAIRKHSDCTIKKLVEASAKGLLGRNTYDYSDFMYCKHLGKVPNNYLITLRRFPLPVDDYISALGVNEDDSRLDVQSQNVQSIGCMVTWLGTPGNDMSNILKYTVSMPFKEVTASLEDISADADSQQGLLNGIAATFDSQYRKQYMEGQAGSAINETFGISNKPPYSAASFQTRDAHKAYGPVDRVKITHMRDEGGLRFDQSFTLVFDYELRSYNGINPRQAMLDLISNILNVVYSTGTFWGGGYRGVGAHQNNVFANLNIFKANKGFTGFVEAFAKDANTLGDIARDKLNDYSSFSAFLKQALNQLGGMLLGGALNKLGRPVKQATNSILSPAPVGFWHVTIGNPFHPIMSIGNMIIDSAQIEHYGPLGLDDFPTGLKVTVTLKRAKSRDSRDIEKLYMKGNDRIYSSMGPKIFDMYTYAKDYTAKTGASQKLNFNTDDKNYEIPTDKNDTTIADLSSMQNVLKKYFGHSDAYSIYVAACEQEDGAHKKPASSDNQ